MANITDEQIEDLFYVWEVLELITVSLDRIGSFQALHGDEIGQKALVDFLTPEVWQKLSKSRRIMVTFLEEMDVNNREKMEKQSEVISYWKVQNDV